MNRNQALVLYAGGAWFVGLFIYRCGSVPGGWGVLGEALGFTIGYSAFSAVPLMLILFFSFGRKKGSTQNSNNPPICGVPRRTWIYMDGPMSTYVKVFLSFASIISGAVLLIVTLRYPFQDESIYQGVFGVILLAAGISYFWITRRVQKN